MLLERARPKRTAASNRSIDRASAASFIFDSYLDLRPHSRAIRFLADKLHGDPIIAVSWILKKSELMCVSRCRSSYGNEQILPPIVPQIGKSHRVSLVQISRAGGSGNI